MREFSVLLKTDPELPGEWIAHCLNWDLVTQGNSIQHATQMVIEAILMVIAEDYKAGFDPSDRPPAPDAQWLEFRRVQNEGKKLLPEKLNEVSRAKNASVAAVVYLNAVHRFAPLTPVGQPQPRTLPPFMIAALQENRSTHGA